ncbi:hypothetical protein Q7P37_002459 [Cladosporium fusiforme]
MHATLLLSALLAAVHTVNAAKSSGCGQPLPKGVNKGNTGKSNDLTFGTSDSATRRYLLHIPENYDVNKPAGLIWSFAGRGKNAEHQEKITKLSDPTYNSDYIVIYPQAETNSTSDTQSKDGKSTKSRRQSDDEDDYDEDEEDEWQWDDDDDEGDRSSGRNSKGQGQWQGDPTSHVDDVKFTLELLEGIEKSFCIDDEKIYASGLSNGGGFVANILACDPTASKKFAAFAAASGAYYQNDVKGTCEADTVALTCNNDGAKVPLVVTHGGHDKVIKYDGGKRRKSCLPSIPHFVTAWAERDGLGSTNVTSKVDNTDVTHYSFGEGENAGMVQSYYVPNLGHKWPMDNKKAPISATKIFMEFFATWNMTARNAAAATTGEPKTSGTGAGDSSSAASGEPSFSHSLGLLVAIALLVHLV